MSFNQEKKNELIEQYCQCDGIIVVNGTELEDGLEYYMDKEEIIHMINTSFSTDDSILHLTDNNMSCKYIEVYRKSDGYYLGTDAFWIDQSEIYNIILPKKSNNIYHQWFNEIINFIEKKSQNQHKSEDINIICHDECCQTWDSMDLKLMRMGEEYTECTIDYCDYEMYDDTDIANLTEKIMNDWDNVKIRIEDIIQRGAYEYAYKMNGFCMIIEKN